MLSKYKDIIITTCCFVMVGLIVLLVVIPVLDLVFGEYGKLRQDKEMLDLLTQKANKLTNLNETEIRSQLTAATGALPGKKESFGLISGIEKLVATNGGKLESLNFSPGLIASSSGDIRIDPTEKVLTRMVRITPFTVVISGNPFAAFDFIALAYRSLRLMGVENVHFADGVTTIKMVTYHQEVKNDLGRTSAPLEELTAKDRQNLEKVASFAIATTIPAPEPVGKTNLFGP